jgi:hypothetical protein
MSPSIQIAMAKKKIVLSINEPPDAFTLCPAKRLVQSWASSGKLYGRSGPGRKTSSTTVSLFAARQV